MHTYVSRLIGVDGPNIMTSPRDKETKVGLIYTTHN